VVDAAAAQPELSDFDTVTTAEEDHDGDD